MVILILVHALCGAVLPLSKWLMHFCSPLMLVGLRMICAGIPLIGLSTVRSRVSCSSIAWHAWSLMPIILCGVYIKDVGKYWALSELSVLRASLLLQLGPLITAFFSYAGAGHPLSRYQWLGVALVGLAGVPLMAIGEIDSFSCQTLSWADFCLIGAMIAHSYSMHKLSMLVRDKPFCPLMSNGIRMLIGGLMIIVTAYFVGQLKPVLDPGLFIGWLFVLALLSNGIAHTVYYFWAPKYYSPLFLSLTDFLSPLFSVFYAVVFLQEKLTADYFIATVIVVIGLAIFHNDQYKQLA